MYLLRGAGEEALSFFSNSLENVLESADRHETSWAAARAILAVLAHRAEKGALPESLQALVPEYLEAVPIDPFDGKELRYSAAKQMVYSVGADGVDAGGSMEGLADVTEPTLRFDPGAWELHEHGDDAEHAGTDGEE